MSVSTNANDVSTLMNLLALNDTKGDQKKILKTLEEQTNPAALKTFVNDLARTVSKNKNLFTIMNYQLSIMSYSK